MNRKLKALGLALGATFAFAAFAASASAETHKTLNITPSQYPAIVTGHPIATAEHPEHIFKPEIGKLTCKKVTLGGTIENEASNTSLTLHPTLEECFMNIGASSYAMTVTFTHCHYKLTEGTKTANPDVFTNGQTSLICPNEGERPHIKVYEPGTTHIDENRRCEYTITPYEHKGDITYTVDTEGTDDITVTENIAGIKLHRTFGGLFKCGLAEQTATYTGETTVTAWVDNGVHVTEDEKDEHGNVITTTTRTYTEGAQLNLTVSGGE